MIRLVDFEGGWRIRRRIEDALAGQTGRFEGQALFVPDADGLRYEEKGRLTIGTAPAMEATRVYLWRQSGGRIEVLFEDGRPFHHFVPRASDAAAHWCDPDQYDVSYDFAAWPDWSAEWCVRGPRKEYRMTSAYTRPD